MHEGCLKVIAGEGRGKRFQLLNQSVTIGRAPTSDIVLRDPAVSSSHCKIQLIASKFYIVDKESRNGTIVNGREIGKIQLLPGDRIEIGDTVLVFSLQREKTLLAGERQVSKRKTLSVCCKAGELPGRKVVAVALILVGGVVLSALIKFFGYHEKTSSAQPFFEVNLVEEKGVFQELVRTEITISNAGNIFFAYDDLNNGRQVFKEAKLSYNELSSLINKVRNSYFFKLSEGSEEYRANFLRLSVILGAQEKSVSFGSDLPEAARYLRDELFVLRDRKFSFPSLKLSSQELIKMAQEAFDNGKSLYKESEEKSDNLFNSIRAFTKAFSLLETVEPKPDFYLNVEEYLTRAQEELNSQFNELRFQAEKAIRLYERGNAKEALESILAKIPDRTDKRWVYAFKRLEQVRKK